MAEPQTMIPAGLAPDRMLCLLDLYWWLSRAWYQAIREVLGGCDPATATQRQHQIAGRKTIALVAGWIARLLSSPSPACFAVAVDSLGPTFRHKMTEGLPEERRYKAGRPARPVAYHRAANVILEIVALHAIPIFAAEGYEADDAIAAATKRGRDAGFHVVIIGQDKDFAALVGPNVWQWAWCGMEGIEDVRDAKVIERKYGGQTKEGEWFGVPPEWMPDWLAIVGDAADNVRGADGIGELGAAQLLAATAQRAEARGIDRAFAMELAPVAAVDVAEARNELKRLDNQRPNLLSDEAVGRLGQKRAEAGARLEELKRKRGLYRLLDKLKIQREQAMLARKLVTLRDDCPIVWRPDELPIGDFDLDRLRTLYQELGFHAMAAEVRSQPKRSVREIIGRNGES